MRERASTGLHVIFGTGPAGCWTARALCGLGMPVRAVNRSGRRPALLPDGVQLGAADLTDPQRALAAAKGAAALGTCDDVTGKLWFAPHVPAITQGEMPDIACRIANPEDGDARSSVKETNVT